MSGPTLGIYIPSYKRAATATTHNLLDRYVYVVRESEEAFYREHGITSILAVKDSQINSVVKVNRWLIENAPEDVIAILDDDLHHFYYRLDRNEEISSAEVIMSEIERIAQLMIDLNIGYAATDPTTAPWNYNSEFEFKGTSGGMRWVNRSAFKAKPREDVEFNWDLDVVLQELLYNRVILKPKYFCSKGLTDTNAGGLSDKKRSQQIASINLMKIMWGKYFHYDFGSNKPYIRVKR